MWPIFHVVWADRVSSATSNIVLARVRLCLSMTPGLFSDQSKLTANSACLAVEYAEMEQVLSGSKVCLYLCCTAADGAAACIAIHSEGDLTDKLTKTT